MVRDQVIRAGVVTVSDKTAAGERKDTSGPLLAGLLRNAGVQVVVQNVVPDESDEIKRALTDLTDGMGVDLVITTGGTGLTPRDVTPEATRDLIEREVPGLAEVLRFEGYKQTARAVLSRGVAGIRRRTLIINLPGSPKAVREGMDVLAPLLPHAVQMLRGEDTEHAPEATVPETGLV
jgi:molybdenum cofactor synthesis domain-containing protein